MDASSLPRPSSADGVPVLVNMSGAESDADEGVLNVFQQEVAAKRVLEILAQKDAAIDRLQREAQLTRDHVVSAQQERDAALEDKRALMVQLQAVMREEERHRQELDAKDASLHALREVQQQLEAEKELAFRSAERVAALEEQIARDKSERVSQEQQLQASIRKGEAAEEANRVLDKNISQMRRELHDAAAQVAALKQTAERTAAHATTQSQTLAAENERMRADIKTLESQVKDRSTALAAALDENDKLIKEVTTAQRNLELAQRHVAELQAENESLRRDGDEARRVCDECMSETAVYKDVARKDNEAAMQLGTELHELTTALCSEKARIEEVQKALAEQRAQNQRQGEMFEAEQKRHLAMATQLADAQRTIRQLTLELQDMQEDSTTQEQLGSSKENALAKAQQLLKETQEKLDRADDRILELEYEVEKGREQERVEALKEEMAALRNGHMAELLSQSQISDEIQSKLTGTVNGLKQKLLDAESRFRDAISRLHEKETSAEELALRVRCCEDLVQCGVCEQEKLQQTVEAHRQSNAQLSAALAKARGEGAQTATALQEEQARCTEAVARWSALDAKHKTAQSELRRLEEAASNLRAALKEKNAELIAAEDARRKISEELMSSKAAYQRDRTATKQLRNARESCTTLEATISRLREDLAAKQIQLKDEMQRTQCLARQLEVVQAESGKARGIEAEKVDAEADLQRWRQSCLQAKQEADALRRLHDQAMTRIVGELCAFVHHFERKRPAVPDHSPQKRLPSNPNPCVPNLDDETKKHCEDLSREVLGCDFEDLLRWEEAQHNNRGNSSGEELNRESVSRRPPIDEAELTLLLRGALGSSEGTAKGKAPALPLSALLQEFVDRWFVPPLATR